MSGLPLPVAVAPPGDAVTVYAVIDAPLPEDSAKLTVAVPSPPLALGLDGAPGSPAGVTAPDADDDAPVPTEFVAVTANV